MRFLLCVLTLSLALPASAQVANGDFESGLTAWNVYNPWPGPSNRVTHSSAGNPGGCVVLQLEVFDGSNTGEGYVEQAFNCGGDASTMCTISVDYKYAKGSLDQGDGGKGHIYIDDVLKLTAGSPQEPTRSWTTAVFYVPCEAHTVRLGLQGVFTLNQWTAWFDNVRCEAPIAAETSTWGHVKALYR